MSGHKASQHIWLEVLRVSSMFSPNSWGLWGFFNCCRIFLLSDRLFPPQHRYGVEESQQASLMQSTFPICSCKFPLFPTWLVILYCQPLCPVLPCIFIILCFSSTTRLSSSTSSSLSLFLSLLFWVASFNFMPPALAVGPLVSPSLALWHTASSGATILPNTQTNSHIATNMHAVSPWAMHRHSCRTYGNKMIQKVALKNIQRHMLSETWLDKQAQWHVSSTQTNGLDSVFTHMEQKVTVFPLIYHSCHCFSNLSKGIGLIWLATVCQLSWHAFITPHRWLAALGSNWSLC